MNLAEQALLEIYPEKHETKNIVIRYSSKFRAFNANVKWDSRTITFSLSRNWLEFSEDLRKGLFQHLLIKMYRDKNYKKTFELDLYEKFTKNLGKYAKVEKTEEELEESFRRINEKYFEGLMPTPNLVWGQDSIRKLGHYEYATDTVVISSIFKGNPEQTDYIMHHELLHKKHGAKTTKTGRSLHHSTAFRQDESKYADPDAEQKLKSYLRKKRIKRIFRF